MFFDFPKMFSHTNLATLWLLTLQLKPGNAETLTQGKQKSDRTHCSEVRLPSNSTDFESQFISAKRSNKRDSNGFFTVIFPKMFATIRLLASSKNLHTCLCFRDFLHFGKKQMILSRATLMNCSIVTPLIIIPEAEPETTPTGCRADQGLRRVPGGLRGSLKDMKNFPLKTTVEGDCCRHL